jgi:hypothetical protein
VFIGTFCQSCKRNEREMRRFTEPGVAAAFAAYPPRIRRRMLALPNSSGELRRCIALALTHHRRAKKKSRA